MPKPRGSSPCGDRFHRRSRLDRPATADAPEQPPGAFCVVVVCAETRGITPGLPLLCLRRRARCLRGCRRAVADRPATPRSWNSPRRLRAPSIAHPPSVATDSAGLLRRGSIACPLVHGGRIALLPRSGSAGHGLEAHRVAAPLHSRTAGPLRDRRVCFGKAPRAGWASYHSDIGLVGDGQRGATERTPDSVESAWSIRFIGNLRSSLDFAGHMCDLVGRVGSAGCFRTGAV